MDGFEVFRFHHVGIDARLGVQLSGNVAHHVLDEFRIVVGAFGDELLVGALEQPIQLGR